MIDTETRWEQARWLLHDSTLKPDDRTAGRLVLLYAQWPAAISRLTLRHVDTSDDQVRIRLGREPVILPEPLGALVLQLAATRHGHAAIGDPGTSPWLLPGGQPGQPIGAYRHDTPRLGFWLDTSSQSPAETADEILSRAWAEARVPHHAS